MDGRTVKEPYSDRRWRDDPGARSPICNDCAHRGDYLQELGVIPCTAFPKGIPLENLGVFKVEEGMICNGNIGFKEK